MRLQLQRHGHEAFGCRNLRTSGQVTPTPRRRPSCRRPDDRFVRDWPSRDPAEELGGINLYTFVLNDPADNTDILGLVKQGDADHWGKCGEYTEVISVGIEKGVLDGKVRLGYCDYCCGKNAKFSKPSNFGQTRRTWTIDFQAEIKAEISVRDELLRKVGPYGIAASAIITAVEQHSNQKLGSFGVRASATAKLLVNWDGCLEAITGGQSVKFKLKPEVFGEANIGSQSLGWYVRANVSAGGMGSGEIYVLNSDHTLYYTIKGKLSAEASYGLGWWQNENGKNVRKSDSGKVSAELPLGDGRPVPIYKLPF